MDSLLVNDIYSNFKLTTWATFSETLAIFIHHIIKLTMQEESNGELALFDNLLSETMGIF